MNTEQTAKLLLSSLEKVIKGKKEVLHLFITAYLTGGHVLLEDVPGVGKTTLVKTFASLIKKDDKPAGFKRIQCTPDLLPYDITGVEVFNAQLNAFEFMEGPVFADILLADELNRTPPKVQAALLEAMAEKQVTVGMVTRPLSPFFFTAATQIPLKVSEPIRFLQPNSTVFVCVFRWAILTKKRNARCCMNKPALLLESRLSRLFRCSILPIPVWNSGRSLRILHWKD